MAQGESIGSVDFSASSAILRTLGIADLRMPFFDLDEKEEEEGEDEEEYAEPRVKVVTKVSRNLVTAVPVFVRHNCREGSLL